MGETQLKMIRHGFDNLPPVVIPEGCSIRTFRPGDEKVWGEIMDTGVGTNWTVERVTADLTSRPQFDPQGLFFVERDGQTIGSACAWKPSAEEAEEGVVHMVCVLPKARGLNLGYTVTLAVLHYFRDHGFSFATLNTDDFRVPAVKAYLRLGFEPVYVDGSHHERWEKLFELIGWKP